MCASVCECGIASVFLIRFCCSLFVTLLFFLFEFACACYISLAYSKQYEHWRARLCGCVFFFSLHFCSRWQCDGHVCMCVSVTVQGTLFMLVLHINVFFCCFCFCVQFFLSRALVCMVWCVYFFPSFVWDARVCVCGNIVSIGARTVCNVLYTVVHSILY